MILVNAIGCKESGARIIAKKLCECYEGDELLLFIVANTSSDYPANKRVKLMALSHPIFGRLLRPFYELFVFAFSLTPWVKEVVNLSSYGLCFGTKQTVYFQNANLLTQQDAKFETGKSNSINRYLLRTCVRNARKIVVQTAVTKRKLEEVFEKDMMAPVEVCLPFLDIPRNNIREVERSTFQGFYPTSASTYKRNELAQEAFTHLEGDHTLVITINEDSVAYERVKKVGLLSEPELGEYYSTSDYLLFTSEVESLGMPLIEALSFSMPAVLPDLDYSREIYGDAAEYFESFDSQSVANAIYRLKDSFEVKRLAAENRRSILSQTQLRWKDHWKVLLNDK